LPQPASSQRMPAGLSECRASTHSVPPWNDRRHHGVSGRCNLEFSRAALCTQVRGLACHYARGGSIDGRSHPLVCAVLAASRQRAKRMVAHSDPETRQRNYLRCLMSSEPGGNVHVTTDISH
jgi:hypothetical protein